jgi:hypothetical protein
MDLRLPDSQRGCVGDRTRSASGHQRGRTASAGAGARRVARVVVLGTAGPRAHRPRLAGPGLRRTSSATRIFPEILTERLPPQADLVRHLPTSHSLFLSRPAELAEMIGEITEASVDPRRPSGDPPAEPSPDRHGATPVRPGRGAALPWPATTSGSSPYGWHRTRRAGHRTADRGRSGRRQVPGSGHFGQNQPTWQGSRTAHGPKGKSSMVGRPVATDAGPRIRGSDTWHAWWSSAPV